LKNRDNADDMGMLGTEQEQCKREWEHQETAVTPTDGNDADEIEVTHCSKGKAGTMQMRWECWERSRTVQTRWECQEGNRSNADEMGTLQMMGTVAMAKRTTEH